MRLKSIFTGLALAGFATVPSFVYATPYASNVSKTGTTVNFLLNSPSTSLTYKINGGATVALDGTTKGLKTFTLGATTDTFSIIADNTDATGFTIPTGAVIPVQTAGPSQPTNESGKKLLSDDTSTLNRFNSPRGISVNRNPNTPNFGTVYISNSAAGVVNDSSVPPVAIRTLVGEGLYALRADGTDAFGYGDTGKNPIVTGDTLPAFSTSSTNSPYHVTVSSAGDVFVADWADANSNAWLLNPTLTTVQNMFLGYDGTPPPTDAGGVPTTPDGTNLPTTQSHGSVSSVYATGSLATGNLVLYTIDEDLNTSHVTGDLNAEKNDRNSIWKYNIGSGPVPSDLTTIVPTKIATPGLFNNFSAGGIITDFDFGADGKIYASQSRSVGTETGIIVVDSTGTSLFNSLAASRTLLNDPAANDIFRGTQAIAVSPDQKWLAVMNNNSNVSVIPLVAGIPDIANRLIVNTGVQVTSGRDISFDAAGNINYVSSGQAFYRVLAPGGHTVTTLNFDGTSYSFTSQTIGATQNANFDDAGTVDGKDFLTWQANAGGAGTHATGDANGDGQVNDTDLGIWKTQFGTTPSLATGSAVPEPSTWASAIVAGLVCLVARMPRRRVALQPVIG